MAIVYMDLSDDEHIMQEDLSKLVSIAESVTEEDARAWAEGVLTDTTEKLCQLAESLWFEVKVWGGGGIEPVSVHLT